MKRAVVALLAPLLLAACASIPSSGPVREVEADRGLGESTARYTPAGPSADAAPAQIVHGFLEAMLAYPATSQIAAQYLTPSAAREWRPTDSTTVYTDMRVAHSAAVGSDREIHLDWQATARLDEQGRYTPLADHRDLRWRLTRVDGQWRITEPPDGMLVTKEYFEDYFRSFDLHFLDETRSHVVPDPVFRIVGDQLPTALLTGLAEGPDDARAADVQSVVPAAARLRGSVPIDTEQIADVEFTVPLRTMPTEERRLLAAQIVWTLQAAPRVAAVRISGSDGVLAIGGEVVQELAGYASFAPRRGDARIAAVSDGQARRIDADSQRGIPDVADVGEVAAVAANRSSVATLDGSRDVLTVRGEHGEVELTSDSGFLDPVVDRNSMVWAVDAESVRLVVEGKVGAVDAAVLTGLGARSFAISPDAARYAVTTEDAGGRSGLLVGAVLREGEAIIGLGPPITVPAPGVSAMQSLLWVTGTRLAMLADGPAGEQAYSVRIDGSDLRPSLPGLTTLLPRIQPTGLAVAMAEEPLLYVLAADKSVRVLTPRGWERADVGPVDAIG